VASKLLDMVDGLRTPSDILVVPWLRNEIELWVQAWGARELGSSAESSPVPFPNPTVRAALESLTSRVTLSTGIVHPSDRAAAITMFRLLHTAGEPFDPDEVKGWLVAQLGWQPKHAGDVADVAEGVLAGKRFRLCSSGEWPADIVDRWKGRGLRDPDHPS
jgi:hypothetical protein